MEKSCTLDNRDISSIRLAYEGKNIKFKSILDAKEYNKYIQKLKLLGYSLSCFPLNDKGIMIGAEYGDDVLLIANAKIEIANKPYENIAFDYTSFKSIDLNDICTSNLNAMDSFFYCSTIGQLNLSTIDTSNVKSMQEMFNNAKIDIIDLSNLNLFNVTNMSWMFYECKAKIIKFGDIKLNENVDLTATFRKCDAELITTNKTLLTAYYMNHRIEEFKRWKTTI